MIVFILRIRDAPKQVMEGVIWGKSHNLETFLKVAGERDCEVKVN